MRIRAILCVLVLVLVSAPATAFPQPVFPNLPHPIRHLLGGLRERKAARMEARAAKLRVIPPAPTAPAPAPKKVMLPPAVGADGTIRLFLQPCCPVCPQD